MCRVQSDGSSAPACIGAEEGYTLDSSQSQVLSSGVFHNAGVMNLKQDRLIKIHTQIYLLLFGEIMLQTHSPLTGGEDSSDDSASLRTSDGLQLD